MIYDNRSSSSFVYVIEICGCSSIEKVIFESFVYACYISIRQRAFVFVVGE